MTEPVAFTPDDCSAHFGELARLYRDSVTACAFTKGFTAADAEEKITALISYLEKKKAVLLGCLDETQRLAGFLWAYPYSFREEERLYVSVVHVAAAFRGQGLGTKLLRAAELEAQRLGIGVLYLHAEAGNEGALRLYRREGYQLERIQLRKSVKGGQADG